MKREIIRLWLIMWIIPLRSSILPKDWHVGPGLLAHSGGKDTPKRIPTFGNNSGGAFQIVAQHTTGYFSIRADSVVAQAA